MSQSDETINKESIYYQSVKEANELLESRLNMTIPESELFYIVKIVDAHQEII